MTCNIAINGFFGRMGQSIFEASINHRDVRISVGCDVEEKISSAQNANDLILTSQLQQQSDMFDVVIDFTLPESVSASHADDMITISYDESSSESTALAGTARSLINNMVIGVSEGFQKTLLLVGVGYRAKASGKKLELTLGFSHPVHYDLPEQVEVETPSQTEVVLKSHDKQVLGQVAAEIRAFRPPEPYKGKGVKYADENIRRKEAKKAAGA